MNIEVAFPLIEDSNMEAANTYGMIQPRLDWFMCFKKERK
ncbi:hypothetical protein DCCM_0127 [Desulfocucumis palustris]|uniref:Uncharacterized protein n=1 Tax=Desulfocucumis palustris TaxID=1898651 RepID=A0A2L2X707_9FIRM|nr:hypothetical protein DCCM_0127 [Desulfocucumis palustris]